MKIKKKTAMLLSFTIGCVMFTTTAFAEIISKSGYEQSKEALKYSAEQLSDKLKSYTVDVTFVIKDKDKVITTFNTVNKYDVTKKSCENVSTTIDNGSKKEEYYYRDEKNVISYNNEQGIYYVAEYKKPMEYKIFNNPFKEKQAGDIEKIFDALIGNLKDNVVVSENADGTKELSGSVSEAQIPALVNAVVSFQFKNSFSINRNSNEQNKMPKIIKDIFIKEVKGKMTLDKNGLVQSAFGTGILYGKDDKDQEHVLTFEALGKLYNVNSTKTNMPDLSGKKVEKTVVENYGPEINTEMYIGKYKNDIIIEKNGKFQKIGESILNIDHIDKKNISGSYTEEYKQGYEDYAKNKRNFKFVANFDNYPYDGSFSYTTAAGKSSSGNISMNTFTPKIYFNFNEPMNNNIRSDGEFNRVFD